MPNCKNIIKNIRNIFVKPVKDEVKEIVNLKPTEQDFKQGQELAVIVVAVLAANGIPMSTNSTVIIGKALAFLVRDIKDGVDDTDKLFISRIVHEIKKVHRIDGDE